MHTVSIAVERKCGYGFVICDVVSLFDTGSPINLIKRSLLPKDALLRPPPKRRYRGLGGAAFQIFATIKCRIKINKAEAVQADLFVVATESLPRNVDVLLGRRCLRQAGFKLVQTGPTYSPNRLLQIGQTTKAIDPYLHSPLLAALTPILERHCLLKPSESITRRTQLGQPAGPTRSDTPLEPVGECIAQPIEIFSVNETVEDMVDFGPTLSEAEKADIYTVIHETYLNADLFGSQPLPYAMTIHLNTEVPFHCSPRRLSHFHKNEVRRMIDELLADGVIRPSRSPYASAIVLVKKKNGETRMCVDYRALNKLTVRDSYPLPLIDDCLDYMDGKRIFSVLDLKRGVHQVDVDEKSVKYTSFVTPQGQYEYAKMPFGLRNAPAVFQRYMNEVLRELIDAGRLVVYMDDILLATNSLPEHIVLLRDVLTCLSRRGLQLNLKKKSCGSYRDRVPGVSGECEWISDQ